MHVQCRYAKTSEHNATELVSKTAPHLSIRQVYAGEDWNRCGEVLPSSAHRDYRCPSTTQGGLVLDGR